MIGHDKDQEINIEVPQTIEIGQIVQVKIGTDQHPATKKEGIVHLIITSTKNKEIGLEN